ncbi:MAG: DsbC family protein [Gammaproteobacteria bacterium]|nr:DsbC family protein [Gammaproteobacteria bacterium]
MKFEFRNKLLSVLLFSLCSVVIAAENSSAVETIRASLKKVISSPPDAVEATAVTGIYEVSYGATVYYVSADGKYIFDGTLRDLTTGENLTQKRLSGIRKLRLQEMNEKEEITYKAKGEERYSITVFTDIDCGYCRKLHSGMEEMNRDGITVHYLAYPRAGIGSDSYNKIANVWCAENRLDAMDEAKGGGSVESEPCAHPVDSHLALGEEFGVTGTPALVLESGELIPGYLPPKRLLKLLESKK